MDGDPPDPRQESLLQLYDGFVQGRLYLPVAFRVSQPRIVFPTCGRDCRCEFSHSSLRARLCRLGKACLRAERLSEHPENFVDDCRTWGYYPLFDNANLVPDGYYELCSPEFYYDLRRLAKTDVKLGHASIVPAYLLGKPQHYPVQTPRAYEVDESTSDSSIRGPSRAGDARLDSSSTSLGTANSFELLSDLDTNSTASDDDLTDCSDITSDDTDSNFSIDQPSSEESVLDSFRCNASSDLSDRSRSGRLLASKAKRAKTARDCTRPQPINSHRVPRRGAVDERNARDAGGLRNNTQRAVVPLSGSIGEADRDRLESVCGTFTPQFRLQGDVNTHKFSAAVRRIAVSRAIDYITSNAPGRTIAAVGAKRAYLQEPAPPHVARCTQHLSNNDEQRYTDCGHIGPHVSDEILYVDRLFYLSEQDFLSLFTKSSFDRVYYCHNTYDRPAGCTGWSANGPEFSYKVFTDHGQRFVRTTETSGPSVYEHPFPDYIHYRHCFGDFAGDIVGVRSTVVFNIYGYEFGYYSRTTHTRSRRGPAVSLPIWAAYPYDIRTTVVRGRDFPSALVDLARNVASACSTSSSAMNTLRNVITVENRKNYRNCSYISTNTDFLATAIVAERASSDRVISFAPINSEPHQPLLGDHFPAFKSQFEAIAYVIAVLKQIVVPLFRVVGKLVMVVARLMGNRVDVAIFDHAASAINTADSGLAPLLRFLAAILNNCSTEYALLNAAVKALAVLLESLADSEYYTENPKAYCYQDLSTEPDERCRPYTPSDLDDTASIEERRIATSCVRKVGSYNYGIAVAGCLPVVAHNCPHNVEVALRERVLHRITVQPEPHYHDDVLRPIFMLLCDAVSDRVPHVDLDAYFERYPAWKSKRIRDAEGKVCSLKAGTRAFAKLERILVFDDQPYPKPRCIQAKTDTEFYHLGPYFQAFAQAMSTPVEVWTGFMVVFTPGNNGQRIASMVQQAVNRIIDDGDTAYFVASDLARQDAHRCAENKSMFGHCMLTAVKAPQLSHHVFDLGIDTFGRDIHNYYTYRVAGRQASGDLGTSTGGSSDTAATILEPLAPHRPIGILLVSGDDSFLVIGRRYAFIASEGIPRSFTRAGHEPTVYASEYSHYLDFCSGVFYDCGGYFRFVPKMFKVLAKISSTTKLLSRNASRDHLATVANGLWSGSYDVPVLSDYLHRLLSLGTVRDLSRADFFRSHPFMTSATPAKPQINPVLNSLIEDRYPGCDFDAMTLVVKSVHIPVVLASSSFTLGLQYDLADVHPKAECLFRPNQACLLNPIVEEVFRLFDLAGFDFTYWIIERESHRPGNNYPSASLHAYNSRALFAANGFLEVAKTLYSNVRRHYWFNSCAKTGDWAGTCDEFGDYLRRSISQNSVVSVNPASTAIWKNNMSTTTVVKTVKQSAPRKRRSAPSQSQAQAQSQASAPAKSKVRARRSIATTRTGKTVSLPGARPNKYLQTLLDPEKYPGVRYPEHFARKTAMVQTIFNESIPFIPSGTLDPPGTFAVVSSPNLQNPVQFYQNDTTSATNHVNVQILCSAQDNEHGFEGVSEDTLAEQLGELSLTTGPDNVTPGQAVNVIGQAIWSDLEDASELVYGEGPAGSFYGLPVAFQVSGTDNLVDLSVSTSLDSTSAQIVHVQAQLVSAAGQSAWVNLIADSVTGSAGYPTPTFDAGTYTGRLDITNVCTTVGSVRGAGLPGIGLRLRAVSDGVGTYNYTFHVQSVNLVLVNQSLVANTALLAQPQNRFVSYDFPNNTTYEDTVDSFRTVSMSTWVEYQGSDLLNGGQLASIMYRGGRSPQQNGLVLYEKLAVTPGSYQGALKFGSYNIWVPCNESDMLFRSQFDTQRWRLPYIVHAGLLADITQPNSLRLRLVANQEIISTSQFYQFAAADYDPKDVAIAIYALHDFPTSMENPLHFEAIRDLLRKALGIAKRAGEWAYDNRGWIVPAGQAFASLLL